MCHLTIFRASWSGLFQKVHSFACKRWVMPWHWLDGNPGSANVTRKLLGCSLNYFKRTKCNNIFCIQVSRPLRARRIYIYDCTKWNWLDLFIHCAIASSYSRSLESSRNIQLARAFRKVHHLCSKGFGPLQCVRMHSLLLSFSSSLLYCKMSPFLTRMLL